MKIKTLSILLVFSFLLGNVVAQKNYYVTTQGGGTGLSWESPTTLQDALDKATDDDKIHLSAGNYTPSAPLANATLVLKVMDGTNKLIEDASILLTHLVRNTDERLAEGITNANGSASLRFYPKSTKCMITVIAPNYEPQKLEVNVTPTLQFVTVTLLPKTTMHVLSYNVLEGFKTLSDKNTQFAAWVKPYTPDVVLLQELNKFTNQSLATLAASYGHPYSVLLKTTGYPTGITSKYPITDIKKVTADMTHGYISCKIDGKNFLSLHFSPNELDKRIEEAHTVLSVVVPMLDRGEQVIVGGDYNSYNAFDEAVYGPDFTSERLMYNGSPVDYTVTNLFLSAGMKDAYTIKNSLFKSSVLANTSGLTSPNKGYRVDYIFMDGYTGVKCTYSDIIHDNFTKALSDHYPVFMCYAP